MAGEPNPPWDPPGFLDSEYDGCPWPIR